VSERSVETIEEAVQEVFDVTVNPLANMLCNLLALQVGKRIITKDDAKRVIASSIEILNESTQNSYVRDMGGNMLLRMIQAIDRLD
jgi:hypothetical protein